MNNTAKKMPEAPFYDNGNCTYGNKEKPCDKTTCAEVGSIAKVMHDAMEAVAKCNQAIFGDNDQEQLEN